MQRVSALCPETCLVFVTYGRKSIAEKSWESLCSAISEYRSHIRLVLVDASPDDEKLMWARTAGADDLVLTPTGTSAATSRNLATTLILDKYVPEYLCMVEDDFGYDSEWYPALVEKTIRLYGTPSPWDLLYGVFSACDAHIPADRIRFDEDAGVSAYLFGAVAYQRMTPTKHFLAVMRGWDPDVMGISYAQTGGQTFRNTMRGFCGAIIPGELSWPLDTSKQQSTWAVGKRDPGPPAHSFDVERYGPVRHVVSNYIRRKK